MFKIWIRLMVLAALAELGISLYDFETCLSRECVMQLQTKSLKVLDIEWKPISVFPEEAKQFRSH